MPTNATSIYVAAGMAICIFVCNYFKRLRKPHCIFPAILQMLNVDPVVLSNYKGSGMSSVYLNGSAILLRHNSE